MVLTVVVIAMLLSGLFALDRRASKLAAKIDDIERRLGAQEDDVFEDRRSVSERLRALEARFHDAPTDDWRARLRIDGIEHGRIPSVERRLADLEARNDHRDDPNWGEPLA